MVTHIQTDNLNALTHKSILRFVRRVFYPGARRVASPKLRL
jgi:hypothetical protein